MNKGNTKLEVEGEFGREAVIINWMFLICKVAWRQREVPDKWRKTVIAPLYKGNCKDDCNKYRGIRHMYMYIFSVAGKVCSRVLTVVMKLTGEKVCEEQGGLGKGRGCIDQIFALKMLVEKYLGRKKSCMQPSWTWKSL